MAYDRINWENTPSHVTPLSAENLNTMDEAIDNIDEELNRVGVKAVNLEARMDTAETNIAGIGEELTEQDTYAKGMGAKTLVHETDIATLKSQVTQIIDGGPASPSELTDVRISENGTAYPTAGEAVRAQVRQMVKVQNTQPTDPGNKLWINDGSYDSEDHQVPTWEEFSELKADLNVTQYLGDFVGEIPNKRNSSNITFSTTNGDITITNNGTGIYYAVETENLSYKSIQNYLTPGKKYKAHCKVHDFTGSPACMLAIRGASGNENVIAASTGLPPLNDGDEGEFEFVATEYMNRLSLFISLDTSTNGSSATYSDIWIREVKESPEPENTYEKTSYNTDTVNSTIHPINMLNTHADDIANNAFISATNSDGTAKWTSNNSYYETGYISVDGYNVAQLVRIGSEAEFITGVSAAFYDENKNFMFTQYPGNETAKGYIVPKNAKYVRFPVNKTLGAAMVILKNVYDMDTLPVAYVPFGKKLIIADDFVSHWKNKVWYGYGTSITNVSNEGKYPNYLKLMSGLNFVNKGISGGGIGDLGGYSHGQVYDAICNITDGKLDADLITLETGANDTGADVPLGSIYDTGRTTLCGCLNDCIRYLQENTSAQIAVFCSPASTTVPTESSHMYYEWASLIEQICRLNRVHFINSDCGLGFAKLNSASGSDYIVDNIHQTDLGGFIYAENIWSQLKDIPLLASSVDM